MVSYCPALTCIRPPRHSDTVLLCMFYANSRLRWSSFLRTLKVSWKMPKDLVWRIWERIFTQTGKCSLKAP